ncbi:MAG: RNA polymerase sporulation sigma factor SigE [Lachnospiraceae bacterium]|nr:RNA polymerase sporulation sigma factor SigE [Lachnospiraceae bacterium]
MIIKFGLPGQMQLKIIPAIRNFCMHQGGDVHYIGGSDILPAPFSPEEEAEYIRQLESGSSMEARSKLIEHNLRLVVYIARKFDNTGVGVEDLISIGTIGLIKAINTFDSGKKNKLATYASRCIENEILMYLRKNSRLRYEVSIDEPLNIDWDGNELLLGDILGTDDDEVSRGVEDEVERRLLNHAIEALTPREKKIVQLRYGLDQQENREMTQKEVADRMGISQSYISRLEKKIIGRLKKEMIRFS